MKGDTAMKHSFRILAFLMALLFVTVCFVSCGNTAGPETKKTEAAGTTAKPEPVVTTDPDFTCDLPEDLNFKDNPDNTIRMMVDAYKYSLDEFYAEEENGNVVNSAVLSRNAIVEEALGVTLDIHRAQSTSDTEVGNTVSKSVAAGDRDWDLCTVPGYRATSFVKGNFRNLIGVDNLNLDKHYWTQGFNEIMRVGDKQYLSSGAYSLSMIRGMYVTVFNKELLADFKMENPYDLVKKDEWTFEKHAEMVKDVYLDDGNAIRDVNDTYGFVGGTYSTSDPYWVSFHMQFLHVNDDAYSIEVDEDKFIDIVTKVHELMFNNTGAYCLSTKAYADNGSATAVAIGEDFCANRAVTAVMEINIIEQQVVYGGFAGKYGIVPIPKYNADQEKYYTHTSDRLTTMAIVSTVPDEDLPMMGAVMEKLAAVSYAKVFPAYYENALSFRFLQDIESKKMLDTVYDGLRIEGAFLYCNYFSMLSGFRKMFTSGEATASQMASNRLSWENKVKGLNEEFAAYQ